MIVNIDVKYVDNQEQKQKTRAFYLKNKKRLKTFNKNVVHKYTKIIRVKLLLVYMTMALHQWISSSCQGKSIT